MVTQILIATMSFSLGILAFCGGIWLTIWHVNQSHAKEIRASLIAGYFILVMAIASLAITSSNLVKAMMYPDSMGMSMDRPMCQKDGVRGMHGYGMGDMNKKSMSDKERKS